MTVLEVVLCLLFLGTGVLAASLYRRYLALQHKHKILQRLYDKAEQQLSTLWANKND